MNQVDYTIKDFIEKVSSKEPTPGGGSVSSIIAALGVALMQMVTNLTEGKSQYQNVTEEVKISLNKQKEYLKIFMDLADEDIKAFTIVSKAYKLPKTTNEEIITRQQEINKAIDKAIEPPMELLLMCQLVINELQNIYLLFNKSAISDFGVAAKALEAASCSAYLNVVINESSYSKNYEHLSLLPKAKEVVNDVTQKAQIIFNNIELILMKGN